MDAVLPRGTACEVRRDGTDIGGPRVSLTGTIDRLNNSGIIKPDSKFQS